MADKIIAAKVQVDTDEAQKNVLKLTGNVDDLRKAFKKAEAGSDEQLAALKKLTAAEEELAKAQTKLAEQNEKSVGAFSKIKGSLSALPGAAGAAGQSITGLGTTLKALIANPVVLVLIAIVGALALLQKAFLSTADGADKMERVMAAMGAVLDVIRDRVLKVAGAIAKFFSGDFKGALSDARAAVSGIGDEIAEEFQRAADATKRLQEVEDALRDLGVSRAKLNRDLAATKEIISDENATYAEKKKAIEEVRVKEGEQTKQELDNAKKKLQALKDRIEQSDISDEKAQELADAQAEVYALEEKSANDIRSLNKQSRTIEKQEEAKRKEERQKADEEEKKRKEELAAYTNKLLKLQQDNQLALIKDGYLKERTALSNKINDEKRQNEEAYKEKKISLEQLNVLNEELEVQKNRELNAIKEKYKKEEKAKEEAFQKELSDITGKTRIAGIKDAQQSELVQLEIGYQEKLKQAIEKYKDDTTKLNQIKDALDEQYRVEKAAKEAKIKEEEDKKKLEADIAAQEKIITVQNADFEAKRAAVDQEQALFQEAFNKKLITEAEYNKNVEGLTEKRKKITELETAHRKAQAEEVAGTLEKLSALIGKKTLAGKLLGIAAATINTFQGASEALKQPSTLPSPFDVIAKIANVTTVIAAGLKTVKEIAKVEVPGGGGGGQSVTAPSISAPAAPIAPTQASTSLDQNTINNIGNAAAGGVNAVRAYVVEEDSAAAAARAARLQGAAVLGG